MPEEPYDVIIMGGGPAGLTTGIYTARHGLKTLILEGSRLGGKAWGPHMIENYPGFPEGVKGSELMDRFIAQTEKFGAEIKEETLIGLSNLGETKMVQSRGGVYEGRSVVIATGIHKKQLRIPGEMEFKGRGVSYCAICDGPFFKDKNVAVIGAGREAVEDALRLTDVAEKVYTLPGQKGYDPEIEELEELLEHPKVQLIDGAKVESIGGDSVVTHLMLKGETEETLEVDGVFIILENVATTDIMSEAGVATDEGGCIVVDRNQKTNIEGIYAAGDCVCGGMQVVTAAGEGSKAGLAVLRYIRSLKKNETTTAEK
jgi:thioredoxin reductase (NADPH)